MRGERARCPWAAAILTLCLVSLCLVSGGAWAEGLESAGDERRAWDQEKLTELSDRLAEAVAAVRQSFRREPGFRQPGNPNRRSTSEMEQILRGLQQSTRQLHSRIRGGAGFEETQGIARKIGTLLNDADVVGRRIMTSAWMAERSARPWS